MNRTIWLLCPICGNKTRIRIRQDILVMYLVAHTAIRVQPLQFC